MANVDRPHGFKILEGCKESHSWPLAAANSIIGVGDFLVLTNAGVVDRAAASATQIIGIAAEAKAASSGGYILIYDDPDIIVEAQTDASSGAGGADLKALTAMCLNGDIVVANATNGLSRMEIDQDSGATTAALPLKVLYLYPAVDNEFGDYNRLVCSVNNHVKKSTGVDGV